MRGQQHNNNNNNSNPGRGGTGGSGKVKSCKDHDGAQGWEKKKKKDPQLNVAGTTYNI